MLRSRARPPDGVDLTNIATRVRYVGSPEHKRYLSFAGSPKPRSDATHCDPSFTDPVPLTAWIAEGIRLGNTGAPWEGDFPRYVWLRVDDVCYEARLVNSGQGHYKGWALKPEEIPDWLE